MNRQGMQLHGLRWHLFGRAVAVRSRRTATISEALLCCRTCSASRGTVVHAPLASALHYDTVPYTPCVWLPNTRTHQASGVEGSHAHHASVHNILHVEYVAASGGGRFQPRSAALQHVGPAAAMGKPGAQRHPKVPMATCKPGRQANCAHAAHPIVHAAQPGLPEDAVPAGRQGRRARVHSVVAVQGRGPCRRCCASKAQGRREAACDSPRQVPCKATGGRSAASRGLSYLCQLFVQLS